MMLGVAALVVVMAVVSGFESTLRNAIVDLVGHVYILKRGAALEPLEEMEPKLKSIAPEIRGLTPFVYVEGILTKDGKVGGVAVQGLDSVAVDQALGVKKRLVEGSFVIEPDAQGVPQAVIGQALKRKFGLKVGDLFSVALPRTSAQSSSGGFKARVARFKVAGVVDLGMHDFDKRYVLTSATSAQNLGGLGKRYSGVRIRISEAGLAQDVSFRLSSELGMGYVVRDWVDSKRNLFEALQIEKVIIFIVVLFITVVACFNIASSLLVTVLRRFGDIGIFKALGMPQWRIMRLFSYQGLALGAVGAFGGVAIGLLVCWLIVSTNIIYVPSEIYNIDHLPVEIRIKDVSWIVAVAMALCWISTLWPAKRGASQAVVEGLKYDER
ncbi:MAG: ABC transporter permease [Oligoflexia bacterium]|nr:ABC transporter permease [Oligoflexia bacterium]